MPSKKVEVSLNHPFHLPVFEYDYIEKRIITLHMGAKYPIFRLIEDAHVFHESSSWNYESEIKDDRDHDYGEPLKISADGRQAVLKGRTKTRVDVLFDLVVVDDQQHPLVQSELEDIKLAEKEAAHKGATGDFRSLELEGFTPSSFHPGHGGGRLRF